MPISIDQFEDGHVPDEGQSVPLRIAIFLAQNDDKAYTRSEIAENIDADPNTVGTALSRLKQSKLVRHRGTYWTITDDRELLYNAYDLHQVNKGMDEWEAEQAAEYEEERAAFEEAMELDREGIFQERDDDEEEDTA